MKLRVLNTKTGSNEPIEVKIDDVITLRNNLKEKYSTNENLKKRDFFLIYKNIVLNNDKILKFYKISDNDEISVRYLDNFLLDDDERILEVFLAGLFPSIMYLIVKQNDGINRVKSIIERIVQNISKIYDINCKEMSMDDKVEDIDPNNKYYKLIISCDNTSVGGENQTIETCCDLHDRFFIDLYMKKFPSICRKIDYEKNWRIDLINKIRVLKEKINNGVDVEKFSGVLSIVRSSSLVESRFLFVTEIAEYINCCCNDYWNETFDVSTYPVRDYFFATLHVCINEHIKPDPNNERNQNIGRKIVIETLGKLENYFRNDDVDWRNLLKLLLDYFLIGNHSAEEINNKFVSKKDKPLIEVRENQISYHINIPEQCHIISELKLAVSIQTNVRSEHLYFIRLKSVEQPSDEDEINIADLNNCLLEIVSGTENIEIIRDVARGGFGKILLCRNTSTNRTFGMKKPINNGDLYGEISNHCRIHSCQHIKTYTGLIFYENCVCMAMEFLSRGSLTSHLKKSGSLYEADIAKLSHKLLTQIDDIHQKDMIHRDINGNNIVFDDNDEAILIDFGLSVHCDFFQDENFIQNLYKDFHESSGYFAPELLKSERFTNKIDIWSFGVVVIEMIYGKRLKPSIFCIMGDEQIQLEPTHKPMSEKLIEFCKSCTKKVPGERPSANKLMKSKFIREYNKKIKTQCKE